VSDSLAGQVLRTGRPLAVSEESKVVTGYRVGAALYVPITYREEPLGVILVDNRQSERSFGPEDEHLLSVLAEYAGIAIKNASHVEDLEKKNRLLTGLHTTGRSALSTLSLDRVLNQIAENALDVLGADIAILYEYDRAADNIIVPPVVQGKALDPEILRDIGKVVPHKQSLVFGMIARRRPFYAPDASQDWAQRGLIDPSGDWGEGSFVTRAGIASSAGIVLATGDEVVGVMFVNYRAPRPFADDDTEIIEMFADQAAIAIQNARLFSLEREQFDLIGRLEKGAPPAGR
jgi:GAF domain-containing protein